MKTRADKYEELYDIGVSIKNLLERNSFNFRFRFFFVGLFWFRFYT
ncbi:hypothetical protein SAMN04488055_4968 [Chitinophaga niabensis]|uniref:Uncharacterized protein n=1 Tax=Chitinophaga niabensis TaxID=536979 RepID=A0A1N6K2T7_9BACT|nr:hypothetical protein SAMN04488055_4968 [Chitinophaga niabensis]